MSPEPTHRTVRIGGRVTVRRSHDRPRPEAPRARDLPATPDSAVTVADRDPKTGKFQPGNTASRGRALRRIAKQLPWLKPETCEEWIRPYIGAAREHAADLLIDARALGPLASPLAEELATARLVYRGLLQLGLAGDAKALEAARAWLREARQHALTFEAMVRQGRAEQPPEDVHKRVQAAFAHKPAAPTVVDVKPEEPTQ